MYGVRHDLTQEFPEFSSTMHSLKHSDPDFARLLAEYDHTDKRIYGFEIRQLPVTDEYFAALKRKRVWLKDRLYTRLQNRVQR